jgi:hypothetical protein
VVIEATPTSLRAFVQGLPLQEYYADLNAALEAYQQQSLFNVIDLATGWKIDLIMRKSRGFSQEEFRRRQQVTLHGIPLSVASVEDVILSKLEWSKLAQSPRQIEDVAGILGMQWNALDQSYLERWILELGLQEAWQEAKRAAGR